MLDLDTSIGRTMDVKIGGRVYSGALTNMAYTVERDGFPTVEFTLMLMNNADASLYPALNEKSREVQRSRILFDE